MTDGHHPNALRLKVTHDRRLGPIELARLYTDGLRDVGRGDIVEYAVAYTVKTLPGGWANLESELRRLGPQTHYFRMYVADGTHVLGTRSDPQGPWEISVSAAERAPEGWLDAVAAFTRMTLAMPAFVHAELQRVPGGGTTFMPSPPIAGVNHVVTTTEEEVAAAYEDPTVFWNAWTHVERHGDLRLCTRALHAIEEEDWLEDTHLSTMELARAARANRTRYQTPVWLDWTQPWWEFGDIQDERAGYPALTRTVYDPSLGLVEYAGFITKRPLREGGEEPRHVLIAEIHVVRKMIRTKKTPDGQPVRAVRVVFPEEWMARQERRPLLDVGAQVYFHGSAGELVAVSD